MENIFTNEDLSAIVDELANVKAQLSDLKTVEDNLKASLIAAEVSAANGTLHRATISQTTRKIVDWQAIAEKFNPSPQLIAAHTTHAAPTFTVRLSARKQG